MDNILLKELKDAKIKLYALLLSKKTETLTKNEIEISYALSLDEDIQQVLEGTREQMEKIRKEPPE